MAVDKKISELTELAAAPASNDMLLIVDTSVGDNKKISASNLGGGAWTAYTPTTTGWAATPTTTGTKYIRIGNTIIYTFVVSGTSNAVSAIVSLPVNNKAGTYSYEGTLGVAQDNGTLITTACRTVIDPGTDVTYVRCYKDMVSAAWTNSGAKLVRGTIIYEVA